MGYEFRADLETDDESLLEKVKQSLCLMDNYSLERSSREEIALRISQKPRQPD